MARKLLELQYAIYVPVMVGHLVPQFGKRVQISNNKAYTVSGCEI